MPPSKSSCSKENRRKSGTCGDSDGIRHSDGGVSNCGKGGRSICHDGIKEIEGGVREPQEEGKEKRLRWYQAFRWWGIGTSGRTGRGGRPMVSGIPMVGYRNEKLGVTFIDLD